MQTVTHIDKLRELLAQVRGRIGLVPTMGNLHEGHIDLVRQSRHRCDVTVATIFVNPMQFGPNEDFGSYPRTLEADANKLRGQNVDYLFTPTPDELYPLGRDAQPVVSVPVISNVLCGASRPGHFDGVTTVVTKLLNIVNPHQAFFGEKDWQQLTVIRRMARQLNMTPEIVGIETVRAADGLALSSRNQYLTPQERAIAPVLYQTLRDIRHAIVDGARNFDSLENTGRIALRGAGFDTDYVEVRDADTLDKPRADSQQLRVLAAATLGNARLIDNIGVQIDR